MTGLPDELSQFYADVLNRALHRGGIDWAVLTYDEDTNGAALAPYRWVAPEWLQLWPQLGGGDPGWPIRPEGIADAFTAILRTNGPQVDGFANERHTVHLAEQMRDVGMLSPGLAARIIQVAVFGSVVLR